MKKALLKSFQILVILSLIFAVGCKKEKDIKENDVSVTSVTLNENKITIVVEETATLTATVYPDNADNKTVRWTSSDESVAEVANGLIAAKKVGTTIITVITEDGNYTAKCTVTVLPPLWVEINGVIWATRNVDAPGTFATNPEDAGMFYQWNRRTGWSSTDPLINHEGGTVWNDSTPEDNNWEKANDPCPEGWRVPTREEQESLIASGSEWTTLNGVIGRYFGSGDHKVFFPAAGFRDREDGTLYYVGSYGVYWSGTPYFGEIGWYAFNMEVTSEYADSGPYHRNNGFSVRCVKE